MSNFSSHTESYFLFALKVIPFQQEAQAAATTEISDDAEKFTSEMHDPCTRSRYLQERTTQKHLQGAPVWSRPNTLRRLSQKYFYNSRVLERS